MPLAVDFEPSSETWNAWQAPLADLRATGEEFDQFVRQQLDELDALRSSLDQREQWLDDERRSLEDEQADVETQWERLEELRSAAEQSAQKVKQEAKRLSKVQSDLETAQAAFAEKQLASVTEQGKIQKELTEKLFQLESQHAETAAGWAEEMQTSRDRIRELEQQITALEANRQELERSRAQLVDELAAATATDADGIATRLAEAEQEKAALKEELARAHQHTSRLAGSALELADSQGQLAQARADMLDLQHRLAQAEKRLHGESQQQIRALEHERISLETELESVRNRIAQMAEEATQEKRRMAEERAEWSGELRQLRRAIEKNAVMSSHHSHVEDSHRTAPTPSTETESNPGAAAAGGEDPVLDSVMAQFEMLQKDLSRRRTGGHKSSRHEPS